MLCERLVDEAVRIAGEPIIMGGDEAALLRLWREKWGEAEPEGRAKFRRYFPKGFRDPLY